VTSQQEESSRVWTLVGLGLALFSLPIVSEVYHYVVAARTAQNTVLRELVILVLVAVLLYIVRRKEQLGWESVGLNRPKLGNTALWILLALLGVAVAITISLGAIHLFGLRFGSADAKSFEALPVWVRVLIFVRAGIAEEIFYRGYALERLPTFIRSRWIVAGLPLVIFATFHYNQGAGGVLIAFLTGAVMTAVYLRKRNLWVNMITHFLVDFIPNIILPALTRG